MMRETTYYPAVGELPRFAVNVDDAGNVTAAIMTPGDGWGAHYGEPVTVGTITRDSGCIAIAPPWSCGWDCPWGWESYDFPTVEDAALTLVDWYAHGVYGDDDEGGQA